MTTSSGSRNPVEVLAEEFLERKRRGEATTPEAYAAEHPDLAAEILALFPALLTMEDLIGDDGGRTGSIVSGAGMAVGATSGRLGDFRLLREVGRGGMGVVYEAEQESLGRRVALKVLPAGALTDPKQVRRFEREARAAARLHHTNIVPVFGVGNHEGTHFYVMQFIQGQGLDAVLDELKQLRDARTHGPGPVAASGRTERQRTAAVIAQSLATGRFVASGPGLVTDNGDPPDGTATSPWSPAPPSIEPLPLTAAGDPGQASSSGSSGLSAIPETDRRYAQGVARIGVQVAEALAYAHDQGILHRDIKPSNLLLDRGGNVWVADFGLAKAVGADDLTHTGDIVGTVRYMAPERFRGEGDARADVYALGLTLYELMALRPAYDESDRASLIRQVTQEDPPRLRRLNRAVPADLETIVHKAMAREPAQRYAAAPALVEDLHRFLEGRPILARRVSAGEQLWRWCRRNPWLAGAIATAAAALVAVALVSIAYAGEQVVAKARISGLVEYLQAALDRSNRLAGDLKKTMKESDRRLAAYHFEHGQAAAEKGDPAQGTLWLLQSWRSAAAAGDPDWQRTARAGLASWQRDCGRLKAVFSHAEPITQAAFSPDGKTVLTASYDKTARLWDTATGRPIGPPLSHPSAVFHVKFSPDGKTIITGGSEGTARLWDAATGRAIGQPLSHQGPVWVMAFSPDGKTLATAGGVLGTGPEVVRFWDATTGQPIGQALTHQSRVTAMAFSPDGKTILTGSLDKTAQLIDAATGQPIGQPLLHQAYVRAVAFSPDGKTMATAGRGDPTTRSPGEARLWERATGRPLGQPLTHASDVTIVAFSPDGKTIITAGGDFSADSGEAQLWDVASGRPIGTPLAHQGLVRSAVFGPDGKTVLTGSADKTARLWDAATGRPVGQPLTHQGSVESAEFSPDGKTVLTASSERTARLWDASPVQSIGRPLPHQGTVNAVAFSPDGKTIITGSPNRTARLWDAATGRPIGQPLTHQEVVNAMAFSPDGKTIATAGGGRFGRSSGEARLWNSATGQPLGQPLTSPGNVYAVTFSPDGKTLATAGAGSGGRSGEVQLWDVATGRPIGQPLAHVNRVSGVAFSPDGKTIITGSFDRTARLWDAATRRAIGQPLSHQSPVNAVAFSPDGKVVVTGSGTYFGRSGELRLWAVAAGRLIGQPLAHQGSVNAVAFSPDGKTIVSGSNDRTARFWDAATGQPIGQALTHQNRVLAVGFSPDGETIVTGTENRPGGTGEARLWDVPTLPDDLPRVATWVEVLTGLELDAQGQIRTLDSAAWRERCERLARIGGPPATADRARLDPIVFGPEPTARARAWVARQGWAEAEAAFGEAARARPYDAAILAERGRFYADRSRPGEADDDFARAYALGARDAALLDTILGSEARLRRVVADVPPREAALLWARRGDKRAREGRWGAAAADFVEAGRIAPLSIADLQRVLGSVQAAGDVRGLRGARSDLLARFGTTTDPDTANLVAWYAVWAPGTDVPPEVPVRLAERALAGASETQKRYLLNTLGAALYRAGRFEEAIRRLEEGIEAQAGTSVPEDWTFLALAHHRLGHHAAARDWLDRFRDYRPNESPARFWDALEIRLLREEAEAVILWAPIFPENPFVATKDPHEGPL